MRSLMDLNVSVVIPLFNKRQYIERAIRSVLAQTTPAHEIIVVDDGSTDDSAQVVRQIGDTRVRLVLQENAGVSVARNAGAMLAASDLVAFLDADDEWQPTFLESALDLRRRFPRAGLYATAYSRFDDAGAAQMPNWIGVPDSTEGGLIHDYFRAAMACQPVCASAVMIPARILSEVGAFPCDVRLGEDLDTWFRIALRYPIAWSPKCGAVYHRSDIAAGRKTLVIGDYPFARSYADFRKHHDSEFPQEAAVREFIAHYRLYYSILGTLLEGHRESARAMLGESKGISAYRRRWLYLRLLSLMPQRPAMTLEKLRALVRRESLGRIDFVSLYRSS